MSRVRRCDQAAYGGRGVDAVCQRGVDAALPGRGLLPVFAVGEGELIGCRLGEGRLVFLIGDYILEGPFHALFEGVPADGASLLHADTAREVQATVGVNEEFYGLAEFMADQRREGVDLCMSFVDI